MSKQYRHRLIREIIDNQSIGSQITLRDMLAQRGVVVNQATLSRDLRELGLIKISAGRGCYRYVHPENAQPSRLVRARETLRQAVHRVEGSGNLVVLRTDTGNGSRVALALDRLRLAGVLGTVAGDDTVIAVVAEEYSAKSLSERILALLAAEEPVTPAATS